MRRRRDGGGGEGGGGGGGGGEGGNGGDDGGVGESGEAEGHGGGEGGVLSCGGLGGEGVVAHEERPKVLDVHGASKELQAVVHVERHPAVVDIGAGADAAKGDAVNLVVLSAHDRTAVPHAHVLLVAAARKVAVLVVTAAAKQVTAMVKAAMANAMAEALKAVVMTVVMTVETAVGMAAATGVATGVAIGGRCRVDVAASEHRHGQMQLVQRSEPRSRQHAPRLPRK